MGAPISVWVHDFDADTVRALHRKLAQCVEHGQTVMPIYIQSDGGDISCLAAMQDLIAAHTTIKVATIGIGDIMSAGAALLAAGHKQLRWVAEGANVMVHECNGGIGRTNLTDARASLAWISACEARLLKRLDAHCGKPAGYFRREFNKRGRVDWHMTAEEAVREGLADKIGTPVITVGTSTETSIYFDTPAKPPRRARRGRK